MLDLARERSEAASVGQPFRNLSELEPKPDLLWRNSSSGQTYLYPMDGRTIKSTEGYLRTVPTSWSVVGR